MKETLRERRHQGFSVSYLANPFRATLSLSKYANKEWYT